jgi:tRNA/tmRNA/rRNA uracil-C5-methylase (TrmA/RlmC/RlmD family)
VDLYSGVGTIGLTIGGRQVTLVEVDEHAVREMRQNIAALGRENEATAVLAASEQALDYISGEACIIVDPPRAGLHEDVVERLLKEAPQRIIYLSCNPVTQARDVARLLQKYDILAHKGYNFFPRTPHIEHLVVLGRKV